MIARLPFLALLLSVPAVQAAAAPAVLKPPADRHIRVAVVLTEGATMIDFAGPWEVFQDVHVPERGTTMDEQMPFELYTVGASKDPIETSGGMRVVPQYTFADAPVPDVVVGAQRGAPELSGWLRQMRGKAGSRGRPHSAVVWGLPVLFWTLSAVLLAVHTYWIEAADYYARVHVGGKGYLIRRTMGELEQALDPPCSSASTARASSISTRSASWCRTSRASTQRCSRAEPRCAWREADSRSCSGGWRRSGSKGQTPFPIAAGKGA